MWPLVELKPGPFGGSSDENVKVLGKFLARLRRAKKRVPKFFACSGLFFVVEALKTAKTVKFSKTGQIFEKRDPKIFHLRRPFFPKNWSVKEGRGSKTYLTLPLDKV